MSNAPIEYRTTVIDDADGSVLRRQWYDWVIGLSCVTTGPLILLPYWVFVAHRMRWATLWWLDYSALAKTAPIIVFIGVVLSLPATPFAWLFLLTGYRQRPFWLVGLCFFPVVNAIALGLCWALSP